MCTGACSKFIAIPLYILAAVSIICNIILFFPDFNTKYVGEDSKENPRITDEVKYVGGLIGGGIMVLIPAIHIHLTSAEKCCANRCGMFLSIGFAAVGVLGGIYSMSTAALGLSHGPVCEFYSPVTSNLEWGRPFMNTSGDYLSNKKLWDTCLQPDNVVAFNLGLFCTLLVASALEIVLSASQMINGLFGCICGTCSDKE